MSARVACGEPVPIDRVDRFGRDLFGRTRAPRCPRHACWPPSSAWPAEWWSSPTSSAACALRVRPRRCAARAARAAARGTSPVRDRDRGLSPPAVRRSCL